MQDFSPKLGLKPNHQSSIRLQTDDSFLRENLSQGYNLFLLQITNQAYKQFCQKYFQSISNACSIDGKNLNTLHVPYPNLNHTDITNGHHLPHSIGLISSWIELDNDDLLINEFSFQILTNEISFATFLGISTFILTPPKNVNNIQIFASTINKIMLMYPNIHLSISLPISQDLHLDESGYFDSYSTWDMWNSIRCICNYNKNLSVSLGAPKSNITTAILDRWLLEPIKFYLISTSTFIPNAKNYPVLKKFNQLIIWKILQYKSLELPTFILHGIEKTHHFTPTNSLITSDHENKSTHMAYIQHLFSSCTKMTLLPELHKQSLKLLKSSNLSREVFANPQFFLQAPLEPIVDNLDNYTYKVFEQDIYKYDQYEKAMVRALIDLKQSWMSTLKPHILFVGPGRGPLIDRFMIAVDHVGLKPSDFLITAIERNPNLLIYLNEKNKNYWNSGVNILHMNSFELLDYKVNNNLSAASFPLINMVISELIGSFGCNELMPESIEVISNTKLCDMDCIFIPQNLSCYISPVFAPKIWKFAKQLSMDKMFIPVVPEMESLIDQPQKIWSFNCEVSLDQNVDYTRFQNKSRNKNNSRQCRISMRTIKKGLIHGLAGYFSSTLYGDVEISNLPKLPNMEDSFSWLPAFFPFENPLKLFDDHEISLFLRRNCFNNCVWYEWSIECFIYMLLSHNAGNGSTGNNHSSINLPSRSISPSSIPSANLNFNNSTNSAFENSNLSMSNLPISRTSSEHEAYMSSNNNNNDIVIHSNDNHSNSKDNEENSSEIDNFRQSTYNGSSGSHLGSSKASKSSNHSARSSHIYLNDNQKVKICTDISRIHNLNGEGFKFHLM